MTSQKIGVLVAIPIKGRKLVNRTGGKQSPYVQLKLGEQKKRTRASLIASVEPEWDQEASLS
jgi:topoisomerase IA-like protein